MTRLVGARPDPRHRGNTVRNAKKDGAFRGERTVALIDEGLMDDSGVCGRFGGGVEQPVEERDLSRDLWLFEMDVTAFDRSDPFEPA